MVALQGLTNNNPPPLRGKRKVKSERRNNKGKSGQCVYASANGFPPNGAQFRAVMDYDEPKVPRWRTHRANYICLLTPEWLRWTNHAKDIFEQVQFAEFLEENQLQVVMPPGAELLEMVQNLEGKQSAEFKSFKRLSNGKAVLEYREEISLKGTTSFDDGKIEVPTMLTLGIAPFQGGPCYKVQARLKYRVNAGHINFSYDLVDPHVVIRDAVSEMIKTIKEQTGIEPLMGSL